MSHLGDRLTALVDGELGHDERDRVLAHLASCDQCRAEAEAQRGLKQRLRSIGDAAPSPELLTRLYAMGEPGGPIPPRARPMPGAAKPPVVARPGAHRPARMSGASGPGGAGKADDARGPSGTRGTKRARRGLKSGVAVGLSAEAGDAAVAGHGSGHHAGHGSEHHAEHGHDVASGRRAGHRLPRMRYLAVGAATLAVFAIGTAGFVAGGDRGRLPQVAPAIDQFAVEHALTSGDVPVTDRDPAEEAAPQP